jgi:hypothetical protein
MYNKRTTEALALDAEDAEREEPSLAGMLGDVMDQKQLKGLGAIAAAAMQRKNKCPTK